MRKKLTKQKKLYRTGGYKGCKLQTRKKRTKTTTVPNDPPFPGNIVKNNKIKNRGKDVLKIKKAIIK